jgi:hypothetical protein
MLPHPHDWYTGLRLRLLPLDISICWSRPSGIPPHILANVLRGAFNITFRKLVCPPEWMDNACVPCPLYSQCPYGQLFEPTPPSDAERLRLVADLPRPFVLKPPLSTATTSPAPPPVAPLPSHAAGQGNALADRLQVRSAFARHGGNGGTQQEPREPERLRFGLVLMGRAVDHLAHFIVTLAELGRVGMGPHRVPFAIESVTTSGSSTHALDDRLSSRTAQQVESLYDPATHTFRAPAHVPNAGDFLALADSSSTLFALHETGRAAELTLRFHTPTLIRTGSGVDGAGRRIPAVEVRERPPFGVLIRRLRDRLSALCTFFGEGPWTGRETAEQGRAEPDFAAMGRLADTVRLVRSETTWHHRSRFSTKTGDTHEISGLTGTATYAFDTPTHRDLFLPLLKCGALIHAGKHAVWGNGWVEVEK